MTAGSRETTGLRMETGDMILTGHLINLWYRYGTEVIFIKK